MKPSIIALIGAAGIVIATFAQQPPPSAVTVNSPPTNAAAGATNAPVRPTNAPPSQPGAQTRMEGDDNQLSFQNANIEMVVQWLAKATGKSVIKHPRVNTQLTIVGSKGLSAREAINLVYRALALEGFTAVETAKSILIVPEGQEPKSAPEFLDGGELPEGRQRLVRIFQVKHVSPAEVQQKIKTALSEKAVVEINERGSQLIVTDYTDNLRLAGELIKELDVVSAADTAIEFFKLKFAEAEEVATLLGQILNAQVTTQPAASPSRSSSSSSSSSVRISGMPVMMDMPSPPPSSSSGSSSPTTTGSASSAIKIWPDRSANQLVVVAPKAKMAEIKSLLDVLDTEKPQDFTIRVIPLKNVSAEDLVREMSPLLQRMTGRSNRDRIEVSANGRSNSLIVLSTEENFNALEKMIAGLDREEAQEKAIRLFELKNADADDVAKQLQDLNTDPSANSRYPYYIFSGSMGGRDQKKLTVVSDRRRNTVIVQAPPSSMEDIEKLIKTLDEPISDQTLAPKIYRMKFVSAVDIADVLNELFLKRQTTRSYWDPFGFPQQDSNAGDKGTSRLYGKVRITAEPYSNSIIITSTSNENLSAIEDVLKELDSPSQAGETTMRITLNFANATKLASGLNVLFAKGGSPPLRPQQQNQPQQNPQQPQQGNQQSQNSFGLEQEAKEDAYFPWLGGQQEGNFGGGRPGETSAQRPVSDLIGKVRVVPDRRSNSILLTSNLHFFPQLLKLIGDLDAPTPQVLIEARIIEVASDFRDKLGVRFAPNGNTFTGDDLDNAVRIDTGTAFSKVFTGLPGGAGVAKSGVFDATMNVDFLIQFLRKNVNAKILAQPQINIADNELGKLFVGAQVPFIAGSLNTDVGGRNDTFQYRDVGIILEVTPRINSSNEVALKIRTESSSIRNGETLFGGAILDTRNFRTDLMLRDGETAVLGGIIQREQNDTVRKTPGLGSVPGLGWAFRKKDKVSREVELMVFLTPRITRSPEQARQQVRELKDKLPLIQGWDDENTRVLQEKRKEKDQK